MPPHTMDEQDDAWATESLLASTQRAMIRSQRLPEDGVLTRDDMLQMGMEEVIQVLRTYVQWLERQRDGRTRAPTDDGGAAVPLPSW